MITHERGSTSITRHDCGCREVTNLADGIMENWPCQKHGREHVDALQARADLAEKRLAIAVKALEAAKQPCSCTFSELALPRCTCGADYQNRPIDKALADIAACKS